MAVTLAVTPVWPVHIVVVVVVANSGVTAKIVVYDVVSRRWWCDIILLLAIHLVHGYTIGITAISIMEVCRIGTMVVVVVLRFGHSVRLSRLANLAIDWLLLRLFSHFFVAPIFTGRAMIRSHWGAIVVLDRLDGVVANVASFNVLFARYNSLT